MCKLCNKRLKTRAGVNIHFSKIHCQNSKRNMSQEIMENGNNEFTSPLNSPHPRTSTSTSGKKIDNNFL